LQKRDDTSVLAHVRRRRLTVLGWHVASQIEKTDPTLLVVGTAGDLEEAIAVIAAVPCDVVLLDVHLPGGHGGGGAEVVRRSPQCLSWCAGRGLNGPSRPVARSGEVACPTRLPWFDPPRGRER